MSTVAAIYENGLFRPLETIDLPEKTRVSVLVPDGPQGVIEPALAAIHEVMAERFESGHHDTAKRHDEHQP